MRKLLLIGLKDLKLMFRDRAALTFMLLAPFLLTIGMGFVTGRFSGSSSGLSDIPVVIVNLDNNQLGNALADVFSSEELADLMEPIASRFADPEAARRLIDEDQAAAAFGTAMGTFIKTEGQATGLSIMFGMVFALMGRCWYPLELFPPPIQEAVKVLPTTWAMQGMLDLALPGGGLQEILPEAGVLLGFPALFFSVGVLRFRYE